MALDAIQEKYIPQDNDFYREHYHQIIMVMMGLIVVILLVMSFIFYQILTRPLPKFYAIQPNNQTMSLTSYDEPNLLAETILRWSSKAATLAYTFKFSDYVGAGNAEAQTAARPYFTTDGWEDYQQSTAPLITRIVENRLLVRSVVDGPPVISNQGPLPGKGYVWRVQIPLLVTYESAGPKVTQHFLVTLSLVRVSTNINPAGIGIDQFVMVEI
jgi:intracellular multiplication protein IcmL